MANCKNSPGRCRYATTPRASCQCSTCGGKHHGEAVARPGKIMGSVYNKPLDQRRRERREALRSQGLMPRRHRW